MAESGMEKHTISVGTDTQGETVSFTAKNLGTVKHNGGSEGGGMDITYFRLPDHAYRMLVQRGGTSILQPSNLVEVFGTNQPAEYGRWTLEELESLKFYGEVFTKLMEAHPEGKHGETHDLCRYRKRNVRDLD